MNSNEDDDVAAERVRIHSDKTNQSGDVLRMIDLVKVGHEEEEKAIRMRNRFVCLI